MRILAPHSPQRPALGLRPLGVVALALALSACGSVPTEPPARFEAPAAWRAQPEHTPGWVRADQAQVWASGQWWALFDDPVLDALIARVDVSNQNLALAVANVAQARAVLAQQQASLWPTLGLSVSQSRSGGEARAATGSASAGLNASWAPDLWDRLGAATRAQQAQVQASEADLAGARLSAQASLVNAYVALRETDTELALMDEIITGYERSARITQNRYDVGTAARTDALQAQSTLQNARSSREGLQRTREGYEHAIALLLGTTPAQFQLAPAPWEVRWPQVPAALPATVLLRRPDVAAAERAVSAANLQIGIARRAYFPDLSLTAGVNGGAANLGDLFSAPRLLWSLGLSVGQAIFDGGAREAGVDLARAGYDASVARYRQTALTAIGEVEDQLSAMRALDAQITQTEASAEVAARIEQQMLNRYESGLADYTEVVTAQASAMNARRSLLQLQLQRQQAAVAFIQALGGGWPGLPADTAGVPPAAVVTETVPVDAAPPLTR